MIDAKMPATRDEARHLVEQALHERLVGNPRRDWPHDALRNIEQDVPVETVLDVVADLMSLLLGLPDDAVPAGSGEATGDVAGADATPRADTVPSHDDLVAEMGDFAERIDTHGFVHALGGHAATLRRAVEALRDHRPLSDWHCCDTAKPKDGSRVVILHEDGSGALLGYWTGEALIDADGDEGDWREEAGAMWAYLPKGLKLWCEVRGEDPYTFPDDETASPSTLEAFEDVIAAVRPEI